MRGSVAAQNLEKSVLDGSIPKALRELVLSKLITSRTHSYLGGGGGTTNKNLRMLRREVIVKGGLILNLDRNIIEMQFNTANVNMQWGI